jgi:predicted amidophosphoribosyltransferase
MIWVALLGLIAMLALLIWRRCRHSRRPEMMTQHGCQAWNPSDANYCRRCGEPLTIDLFDESGPEKR